MYKNTILWGSLITLSLTGAACNGLTSRDRAAARPSTIIELADGASYDLVAEEVTKSINGVEQTMLAYNGMIPGPLIKLQQGASITVNFTNNTSVDSSVHSHGLRLDYRFDGTHLTQHPVKPGETFAYTLTFPDAGIFWYHPHFAESYAQERGLYGNYLVVASDDSWSTVNREEAIFIDDVLLESGRVSVDTDSDRALMGRYGNTYLINGETDYVLNAAQGEIVRLYLTNAANARPFNLAISGHRLKLVGADGGLYERDRFVDSVTIGPSERAIVEVLFENPGSYAIRNATPVSSATIGRIVVGAESVEISYAKDFARLNEHASTTDSIAPYRELFSKQPDKRISLDISMSGMMMGSMGMGGGGHMMNHGGMMQASSPDGIEWEDTSGMMNAMSNSQNVTWELVDLDTGQRNENIHWEFERGDIVKIRIFNDPDSDHPMQHPIHFHGQRFLVLSRDNKPETNLVWKDTAMIPTGQTVDLLVEMTNPGEWMAHCHISEHLEAGMALTYTVS